MQPCVDVGNVRPGGRLRDRDAPRRDFGAMREPSNFCPQSTRPQPVYQPLREYLGSASGANCWEPDGRLERLAHGYRLSKQ